MRTWRTGRRRGAWGTLAVLVMTRCGIPEPIRPFNSPPRVYFFDPVPGTPNETLTLSTSAARTFRLCAHDPDQADRESLIYTWLVNGSLTSGAPFPGCRPPGGELTVEGRTFPLGEVVNVLGIVEDPQADRITFSWRVSVVE